MKNPFGENVRIVDRRRVDFNDINRHIDMQDADPLTNLLAKLKLSQIRDAIDSATAKGDFATAERGRAAVALRRSGVPPELTGRGQLHEVVSFDPRTGRSQTEYFGDPKVWRSQFEAPAVQFKTVHPTTFTNKKTTVQHKAGERVVVMDAGGNIVRGA